MGQGFHVARGDENVAGIEALSELLGGRVGLAGLLPELKHSARPSRLGRALGRAVDAAWRWDAHDSRDRRWWPQGVSSSADASESEEYAGRRLLVATWYARDVGGGSHGSRVTFLDLETLRYRHVLLVEPRLDATGRLTLSPLRIHAGGIVWRGRYLHVAATVRGFMTCRIDDVMRVDGDDGAPDRFGIADGRVTSYGHRYVLPVRFTHRAHTGQRQQRLRYSFLSLDRSTPTPGLLAGEYGRDSGHTRLARFDLDGSGLPVAGEDGSSVPVTLDDGGVFRVQGAVTARGRHHLMVSNGSWLPGSAYVGRPGSFRARHLVTPMGPEDVSYWPSTDRLWSLTEHPGRRWFFSMPAAWFD